MIRSDKLTARSRCARQLIGLRDEPIGRVDTKAMKIGGVDMNREEILAFLNKNQVCHLATIDGNQPRVRAMMMYRADGDGILFHTARMKDLSKQIEANPLVEVCFNNMKNGVQVRISGSAEFIDDQRLKEEIVTARSFLKPWVDERGYEMLGVFRHLISALFPNVLQQYGPWRQTLSPRST